MSFILTAIKIISFLFPFLKELFLGKKNNTSRNGNAEPDKQSIEFMKLFVIVLGCMSVCLNYYLVTQAYNLGRENLELKKQIREINPKPLQYPEDHKPDKPYKSHSLGTSEPVRHNKNNNRNKKVPSVPPLLPPDRETYLRELEEINKIN